MLVSEALEPLAELVSSLMDPARLLGVTQVHRLWERTLLVANSVYLLLVMAGGVVVMTHETLHTRYALREVAPRLVAAPIVANLSWWVITHSVELAAAIAAAIAAQDMTPGEILSRLLLSNLAGGPMFVVLLNLVLVVLVVALVLALIITGALLLALAVIAPLALMLHALPTVERVAWAWWRAFGAALAIPTLHGITLALLGHILLTPGSFGVILLPSPLTAAGALVNLLVVISLLYLMYKIPFWAYRWGITGHPRAHHGGVINRLVKTSLLVAGVKTFGLGSVAAATAGRGSLARSLLGPALGIFTGAGTRRATGAGTSGAAGAGTETATGAAARRASTLASSGSGHREVAGLRRLQQARERFKPRRAATIGPATFLPPPGSMPTLYQTGSAAGASGHAAFRAPVTSIDSGSGAAARAGGRPPTPATPRFQPPPPAVGEVSKRTRRPAPAKRMPRPDPSLARTRLSHIQPPDAPTKTRAGAVGPVFTHPESHKQKTGVAAGRQPTAPPVVFSSPIRKAEEEGHTPHYRPAMLAPSFPFPPPATPPKPTTGLGEPRRRARRLTTPLFAPPPDQDST